MNAELIQNWNRTVCPTDYVFHLGDVAFGSFDAVSTVVAQLNGYKILVKGNHDRRKTNAWWLRAGFQQVYPQPLEFSNCVLSHEPVHNPDRFNIHGHMHDRQYDSAHLHKCVSVEVTNYYPVLWKGV